MAEHRIKLAEKSRTPLAAEQLNLKPKDLVEIYRQPANKDRPGWVGPARVVDTDDQHHGKIAVNWQGRILQVPLESLRRALTFIVFGLGMDLATIAPTPNQQSHTAIATLMRAAENMVGRSMTLGWTRQHKDGNWHLSTETHKHQAAFYALLEVARRYLQISNCWAGTLARGVQRLPSCSKSATSSLVIYWNIDERDDLHSAQFDHSEEIIVSQDLVTGKYLPNIALVQFFLFDMSDDRKASVRYPFEEIDHMPESGDLRTGLNQSATPEVLSPISLGSGSDVELERDGPDQTRDEDFWAQWLEEMKTYSHSPAEPQIQDPWFGFYERREPPETELQPFEEWQESVSNCCLTTSSADIVTEYPLDTLCTAHAEMEMPVSMAYLSGLVPAECHWTSEDRAVLLIDKNHIKQVVIERNTAQSNQPVTQDEMKKNPEIFKKAITAELQRWVENASFKRQLRKDAENILSSRYVVTWKRQEDGSRIMKCRMCVRGFEDMYKQDLDRYSGTSTRWGQRMVVATAIQKGWQMASLDISVAFLKGMSFDEVQKIRGGPKRKVSMQLPHAQAGMPSGVQLLRQFPGLRASAIALKF